MTTNPWQALRLAAFTFAAVVVLGGGFYPRECTDSRAWRDWEGVAHTGQIGPDWGIGSAEGPEFSEEELDELHVREERRGAFLEEYGGAANLTHAGRPRGEMSHATLLIVGCGIDPGTDDDEFAAQGAASKTTFERLPPVPVGDTSAEMFRIETDADTLYWVIYRHACSDLVQLAVTRGNETEPYLTDFLRFLKALKTKE